MTAVKSNKKAKKPIAYKPKAVKTHSVLGPYIKLQTKLAFTNPKRRGVGRIILHYAIWAAIFALVLFFLWRFFMSFNGVSGFTAKDVAILLFTVADIFVLIYFIVAQCKRLFSPEDLNTILTFPMSRFERYIGEITTILIKGAVYNFVILYPIVMVYMGSTNILTTTLAFTSLFSVLFMPIVPFGISLLLSIPFILIHKALRNKEVVKFILFIIVFLLIIACYAIILAYLADWWRNNGQSERKIITGIADLLNNMNKWYNPAYYSSIIALNWKLGWAFLIEVGILVAFGGIGIAISYPLYKKMTVADGNEGVAKMKVIKYDDRGPYASTFIKDFKQIFRTPSYAYFFLGVAICMPILTFMIVDLIKILGEAKVGPETFFGLALVVVLVIISLIGSYSANVISKEQSQFYMSKIVPVSAKKYFITKESVIAVVGFGVLLLCTIVLMATSMRAPTEKSQVVLTPTNILVIFGSGLFFLVGVILNGLNINLGRPAVNLKGEPNESNVAIQLVIGVILSVVISEFALLVSTFLGKQTAILYVIVLAFTFAYALINFLIFWFTVDKRFDKIEIK